MCIICIKQKGIQFPSVNCVETMCDKNPHGFSMVVSNGYKSKIFKTLDVKKFINEYQKVIHRYDYKDTAMFIHARIKTHGSEKIQNCHGWRENGLYFAHNGILSIQNRGDMTDSETYFRDIFSPIFKVGGWRAAEKTIDACIGSSKFVFMDEQGNIHHYGNYIEDDGLLFSNTSYKKVERMPIQNYGYGWWRGYYKDEEIDLEL